MAKQWSWSYSKKKNYDTCPKRHYEVDVLKKFTEDSEQLDWGNSVHSALANACTGKMPLPQTMTEYQWWVDRVREGPGELLVEQKFALTREFEPTEWFGNRAWYRGIADVLRIDGPVALALDWKTGKQNIPHDSTQLMLMASCVMAFHPEVKVVRTEYIWLKEDCSSHDVWTKQAVADGWGTLLPQIKNMEEASKTLVYPEKPSGLCKSYCPVTTCQFFKKGFKR